MTAAIEADEYSQARAPVTYFESALVSTGSQSGTKNKEAGFPWQWRAASPPTASQNHCEH
jgi:hypothetical protein